MPTVEGVSTFQKRLLLGLLFFVAFLSYTWRNQFPFFYHSDEESKALQLLYGYHNYWHPMLMLNATRLIARLGHYFGMETNSQSLTMIGRTLSAIFGSVGVVSLVQFAWRRRGTTTALLTGCLLLTLPLLFEVGHFCKEDPALFMGLTLTLLAMDRYLAVPDRRNLLWLGAAAGLATSAKYPGAFLILAMLPVIYVRSRKITPLCIFLLISALTLLSINWQWLTHLPGVLTGIQRESVMLTAGHDGVSGHFPSTLQWHLMLYELGWPILVSAALGFILPQRRGEVVSMEFILGLLVLIILSVLSYSAKISDRYLLPVMVVTLYLSACGIFSLARFLPERLRALCAVALLALVSVHPISMLTDTIHDFGTDSRANLAQWISENVPKNEPIATSLWTRLPSIYPGQYASGIAPLDYVADFGTLDDVRRMGFRWIAVANVECDRFRNVNQTGEGRSESAFAHRRHFYQQLIQEADLRWSAPRGVVYNLHPGLMLYELRSATPLR